MKIKPEHYNYIDDSFNKFSMKLQETMPIKIDSPLSGLKRKYKELGLSDERFRWDILNHAGLTKWVCDNLYPYLNDSHIDTALKRITENY